MQHTAVVEISDESNAEYHADYSRISHSMVEVFRSSPIEYAARFVHRTMSPPAPTPAMKLGTALHAFLLEHYRFNDLVAVAPRVDRRTKDGKAEWAEFESQANGRTVITEDDYDVVTAMAKSVLGHPEAFKMFQRAEHREKSITWTNEQTGLACKCRPDLLYAAGGLIADLKTASDPTPGAWSRQAASLGYHRQGAYYSAGVGLAIGRETKFMHIVVGTSEPFEACAYFMDSDAIAHAEFQNQQMLNEIAAAMESGVWSAPQNREILVVSLPRWAMYE